MKQVTTTCRALAAAGALTATSLFGMSAAHAHDELISSNPADGATLVEAPSELELTYSGEIMDVDGANQVRVTSPTGQNVTDGAVDIEGTTVTQNLSATEEGQYTVAWRVVSSDGHPIEGTFTYTVGEASTATPNAEAASSSAPEPSAANTGAADAGATNEAAETTAASGLPMTMKVVLLVVGMASVAGVTVAVLKSKGAR